MTPTQQWLDTEKAAEHLCTTAAAIHKLVQRGTLKAYRLGRHLRFRVSDLDASLDMRRGRKQTRHR